MASDTRRAPGALSFLNALEDEPHQFDFFFALRTLECAFRAAPRIGESRHAAEDAVRLAQEPHTIFAPSALADFKRGAQGKPGRLSVYFLGLLGPNGPMPLHLSEYAVRRIAHHRDYTFSRFLDVFHHRMLALFYRAWANSEPTVSLDRPGTDRFSSYVGALFGLGTPGVRNRDEMADHAKLHFAGRFVPQTRNAEGLRALLGDFFRVPFGVLEFVGHWLTIPDHCRWRLGESPDTGELGRSIVLGRRVKDYQHKFRLLIGPMSLAEFESFLPGGDNLRRLMACVRNYAGDERDWDVQLTLAREEVPELRLGGIGRLGWSTWLKTKAFERDAQEVVLDPFAPERKPNRERGSGSESRQQRTVNPRAA